MYMLRHHLTSKHFKPQLCRKDIMDVEKDTRVMLTLTFP